MSVAGTLDERSRATIQRCITELTALLNGGGPAAAVDDGPYPLTDLQQAYLVGEQGVAGHPSPALYMQEYRFPATSVPDHRRFATAVARVRRAYPVLRSRITPDARQVFGAPVAAEDPGMLVEVTDRTGVDPARVEAELAALRAALPRDVPAPDDGRPFLFRFVLLPGGSTHLQIALRLTVFDGVTIQLFFAELAAAYADDTYVPAGDDSYRDFLAQLSRRHTAPAYRAAEAYWRNRLETLPPAVDLPRASADAGRPSDVPLHRVGHRLPVDQWKMFRRHAADHGISPGLALFNLYVETLLRWSGGRPGTVSVLSSARAGLTSDVPMWGNAASTILVGYDETSGTFLERCEALRMRFYDDLDAAAFSGVEVGREINRRAGGVGNPVPVVFSSGLDLVPGLTDGFRLALPGATLADSSIATPEVFLDHQVFEFDGELVCNFDHDRATYPPGMIDDMAEYHRLRLEELAAAAQHWTRPGRPALPEDQLLKRREANRTSTPGLDGELHEAVIARMRAQPDAVAVIDAEGTMTYGELDRLSGDLALRLRAAGVGRNPAEPDLVAVHVPRSWQQPVAVLAVLRAGGAYLPVSPAWPRSRIAQVLTQGGATAVVTATGTALPELPELPSVPVRDEAELPGDIPDGLGGDLARTAYVIYTSGSTGIPKGVVISHGAATNTLLDLTGRLGLTPADRVLSVSSLAFDLSVFDIFAILGAGGTMVLPPHSDVPEPERWGELCHDHHVTVWNSVPALLAMSLEYLSERAAPMLATLRLAMLSGDWIPLPLLARMAEVSPSARVLAMGGATEASIWSNYFWADELPEGWATVPYGRPLANQTMHVLDKQLADAPTWVPGDLYIGGTGVADGYRNAPELTASFFSVDAATGERRYRTGDRARYRPDGLLEFLGREDDQVKVGGHRIELGEIEVRLLADEGVRTAVALVAEAQGTPYLAAFVTPRPGHTPDPAALRAALTGELPSYMVPGVIQVVDDLPLSSNGKVDRKKLLARLTGLDRSAGRTVTDVEPQDRDQTRLLALWRELLGPEVRGTTDDFFALGGNSLLAVRLFHRIQAEFGQALPLSSLMRNRTVADQARLLRADDRPDRSPLVSIKDGDPHRVLVMVHPVGGDVLCYQPLVGALEAYPGTAGATVYGLRATAAGPDEAAPPDLPAMAARYADEICRRVPEPATIHLVGWSMGGTLAVHLDGLLTGRERRVGSVAAIDSFVGDPQARAITPAERFAGFFHDLARGADVSSHIPADVSDADLGAVQERLLDAGLLDGRIDEASLLRLFSVYRHNSEILERHQPAVAPGRLLLLRADETPRGAFRALRPLAEALPHAPSQHDIAGDHYSVMRAERVPALAALIATHVSAGDPAPLDIESSYLRGKLWC